MCIGRYASLQYCRVSVSGPKQPGLAVVTPTYFSKKKYLEAKDLINTFYHTSHAYIFPHFLPQQLIFSLYTSQFESAPTSRKSPSSGKIKSTRSSPTS